MESKLGSEIQTDRFTEEDHVRFKRRLDEQLRALDVVLKRKGFGAGPRTLGAELELCLVDAEGHASAVAEKIVEEANTPLITPEMGAFDIELSTPPVAMAGKPFSALRESMQSTVRTIRTLAAKHAVRAVPVSILPTLRAEDFAAGAITDQARYHALARGLKAGRQGAFEIHIQGEDRLHFESRDAVAMEAANTAFQVHLSCDSEEFASLFNAVTLLTGPMIAAAANSPTFLGRRLWHETRAALFKQAGDDRPPLPDADMQLPPRVNFGNGWLREGAQELFMESVALHAPILAECSEGEDSLKLAAEGGLPSLCELRLHHGTVWSWNRPVYDPAHGGGLRIELRAFPAGPSYDDMLANAGFLIGASLAMKGRMPALINVLPFALAKQNFNLAAQHGLEAQLTWASPEGGAPVMQSARDLLLSLMPLAREGLREAGVDAGESEHYLGIFEARVRSGQTGAVWQRATLDRLQQDGHRGYNALTRLLDRYIAGFDSQRPVHAWPLDLHSEMATEVTHV
jgi:gamma-glutamyl:cysteine ligase YbdK (ATP-grasp superfamily)